MSYRLRQGARILRAAPDRLYLTFANHTVELTGTDVVAAAEALLSTFNSGQDTDASLKMAADAVDTSINFVGFVLDLLVDSHCLYDDRGADSEVGPLRQFLAATELHPDRTAAALGATAIHVVAPANSSDVLADCLSHSGMPFRSSAVEASASRDAICEVLDAAAEPPAIVACWGFAFESAVARSLNQIALAGPPVLFGISEGLVGRVGPFVLGRGVPCLECVSARMLTNAGPAAHRRALALRHQDETVTGGVPCHPVFERMCAALFVLELERIALRRAPATLGGVVEVSVGEPTGTRREVLRVPRCPACARQVPPQLPWNTLLGSPEVKAGTSG